MISIFILSIKTYSLAKGSSPGFLYYILAEVKIHYTRDGVSSHKSATRLPHSDFHGAFTCYDVLAAPSLC